jgi:hypothetical protein
MSLEVRRGPTPQGQPSPDNQAATTQLDGSSIPAPADIEAACTAYMVLLVSARGTYLRKPYMSLHNAEAALRRAQDRGQSAYLVLCKLTPVGTDLYIDGGDQE